MIELTAAMRKDVAPGYDEATKTESLKAVVLRDRSVVVWGAGAAARLELDSAEGVVGNGTLAGAHYAFVDPRIAALGARLVYPADFPIEAKLALRRTMPCTDWHSVLPIRPRSEARSAIRSKPISKCFTGSISRRAATSGRN